MGSTDTSRAQQACPGYRTTPHYYNSEYEKEKKTNKANRCGKEKKKNYNESFQVEAIIPELSLKESVQVKQAKITGRVTLARNSSHRAGEA